MKAKSAKITTIGELEQFIAGNSSIPDSVRPHLLWAVRRIRRHFGHGAPDFRLDPKALVKRLNQLSAASAGLSPRTLANLKSRFRAALRHAEPRLAPGRSRTRLDGPWAVLYARLPRRQQFALSRFMRFAQDRGVSPDQVDEAVVLAFEEHAAQEIMPRSLQNMCRATRRAWNDAADTVPGWPQQHVDPPTLERTAYWLEPEALPRPLHDEIEAHLNRMAQPASPFSGTSRKAPAKATVDQYRWTFITIASALVGSGRPLEELDSIAELVSPTNLHVALSFLHDRAGKRVTPQIVAVAHRARQIAGNVEGVSPEALRRLDDMLVAVKRDAPPSTGMTEKNRRLIDQLDDPAFIHRLVHLPSRLLAEAEATRPRFAAGLGRDAVAVELLLTCSMRVGNLARLRLGETIQKVGTGANGRWVIDIPKEEVKNGQPLRFTLPSLSAQLVEQYLVTWQDHWSGPGCAWLFPDGQGHHVSTRMLSESVAQRAARYVGARITCHQFRHLAAELYLRQDPNGIGIVSQHLGHRDLSTTQRFYAREQTKAATTRYNAVLERTRLTAEPSGRRSTRPRRQPA